MSTTSTLVTTKAALLDLLTTELAGVQCSYAWPGPDTANESVFLGRHPGLTGDLLGVSSAYNSHIPTIKAGRKQRQESYEIDVTLFSFRPDLTAAGAQTAETRGMELLAGLENVLATDPKLGLTSIQWAQLARVEITGAGPIPFEKGYASVLVAVVAVESRLT